MKKLLIIALITLSLDTLAALSPGQDKRFSHTGYPYNLLIQRSDSIKIIYTEKDKEIACRVTQENSQSAQTSASVITTKAEFDQAPLASCLPRKLAKQWLAQTF